MAGTKAKPATSAVPATPPPAGRGHNPFSKPEAIKPTIMALVSGSEGVGKTYIVLKDAPRPLAVIDSEGSAQFYVGREGFAPFDLIHTKSYREVMVALDYIEANPGVYASLVIDGGTVLYSVLQDAAVAARTAKVVAQGGDPADVDIEMREWGRIKRLHKALMSRLMNLPVNVLMTAREKDLTERRGSENVKIGVRPDADKGIGYDFALTVRLSRDGGKRTAKVTKDWSGVHGADAIIVDPTWANLFAPLLKRGGNAKATRAVQTDAAAAHEDSTSMGKKLATSLEVAALVGALTSAGYDPDELREKRGWLPYSEMGSKEVIELTAWAKGKLPKAAPAAEAPKEGPFVDNVKEAVKPDPAEPDGGKSTLDAAALDAKEAVAA